jgi:hypothetical protein
LFWPLRLTLAGLWAERLVRAFWPVWTVLVAMLAVLSFGVQDVLPLEVVWTGLAVGAGCAGGAGAGGATVRRPTRAEALARLDAALPGRPIAALTDTQAIGATDPASQAVWQAHVARMAARAAQAKAVQPDLRLARRDPFALRYVALTALVIALAFGSLWRVASVAGLGTAGRRRWPMAPHGRAGRSRPPIPASRALPQRHRGGRVFVAHRQPPANPALRRGWRADRQRNRLWPHRGGARF